MNNNNNNNNKSIKHDKLIAHDGWKDARTFMLRAHKI